MTGLKVILGLLAVAGIAWNIFRSLRFNAATHDLVAIDLKRAIVGTILILFMSFSVLPSIGYVPAGYRGVVLRFGAVTGKVLGEGFFVVTPVMETVQLMNVQIRALHTPAAAASKDLQEVKAEVTVNYRLDPMFVATVYQDLREDYEARIIAPAVQEAIKAGTSQFEAERLIGERASVRDKITSLLGERMLQHHFLLDAMSITDFSFSDTFDAAIEAKVTATQKALEEQNNLKAIEFRAQQTVATAKAEAERIRIQAASISSQGGAEYVRMKAVEKWNGELPTILTGGSEGQIPFILNVTK